MTPHAEARHTTAGKFMPYRILDGWLEPESADALLAYAIENEPAYKQGAVLYNGQRLVDAELRSVATLPELGPFAAYLRERALAIQPELERSFGAPAFVAKRIEVELAAHGDGAHFHRHVDTFVVVNRAPSSRIITLVLYLHRRPCRFTGGELRMHALGSDAIVDIAPVHNRLIAFPSIAPHSVAPVSCAGDDFADRRFAINMWIHRDLEPTAASPHGSA
jgi:SM-20-related protein